MDIKHVTMTHLHSICNTHDWVAVSYKKQKADLPNMQFHMMH